MVNSNNYGLLYANNYIQYSWGESKPTYITGGAPHCCNKPIHLVHVKQCEAPHSRRDFFSFVFQSCRRFCWGDSPSTMANNRSRTVFSSRLEFIPILCFIYPHHIRLHPHQLLGYTIISPVMID